MPEIDREGFGPLPWWVWGLELGLGCILLSLILGIIGLSVWPLAMGVGFILAFVSLFLAVIQA